MASVPSPAPPFLRLPRSSTRLQKDHAHIKLVKAVRDSGGWVLWEGTVYPPGGTIPVQDLPDHAVLLECAGPIGTGRNRDWLWILWRLDRSRWEWREVARSQGLDNSATWTLREAALAALNPDPGLYEVSERARGLADSAVRAIDDVVAGEAAPVKLRALSLVYDQVAGRIAREMG